MFHQDIVSPAFFMNWARSLQLPRSAKCPVPPHPAPWKHISKVALLPHIPLLLEPWLSTRQIWIMQHRGAFTMLILPQALTSKQNSHLVDGEMLHIAHHYISFTLCPSVELQPHRRLPTYCGSLEHCTMEEAPIFFHVERSTGGGAPLGYSLVYRLPFFLVSLLGQNSAQLKVDGTPLLSMEVISELDLPPKSEFYKYNLIFARCTVNVLY